MDDFVTLWSRVAWAQCWQVTLLIAGVWLAHRTVGRNRPHLACALWLVVLAKCITPPLVSSPSGIFCWLQRAEQSAGPSGTEDRHRSRLPAAVGYAASSAGEKDAVVVRVSRNAPPAALGTSVPPAPLAAIAEPATAAAPQSVWSWPRIFKLAGGLWLTGLVIYAGVAARRWMLCWRMLKSARHVDDPALALLLDDLRRRLKVTRRVRLLITGSSLGPAVIGLWRPTIVLPAALVQDKTPVQLEPLLAHELIHVRRGDLWIGMLQTLALGLWWFHPLVRLASRLVTREAERCCDEEVIAHLGCDPAQYARTLIDVLALKRQLTPIPAFPGVRPVDVTSKRLERIMKLGQGCHRRTPWWCWVAMVALAAAVLPGAALVVRAKEKQPVPPPDLGGERLHADLLPPPAQQAALAEALIVRTYDVADVVTALGEQLHEPETKARHFLVHSIQAIVPGPWETGERIGVEFGNAPADPTYIRDVTLISDPVKRSLGWSEGKLIVRQTVDGHQRIAEQLDVLRKHGHAELAIEVRIVSGQKAVLTAAGADWRMIVAGGNRKSPRPAGVDGGTSESIVERHVPAMLSLVDEKQAKDLLTAAQGDQRTNVIQAPKVTLFNGQTARVEDSVQRPFVVGVTPSGGSGESALQPKIRVVTEGTTIRLRPVARKDGAIELDFGLELSGIRSVETAEFPTGPGKDPITIQVPEVATTLLDATVEMRTEQTLVLSLPKTGKGKTEQQPMCVLVKVKRMEGPVAANAVEAAEAVVDSRETADAASLQRRSRALAISGWRLEFTNKDGGTLDMRRSGKNGSQAELHIRGGGQFQAVTEKREGEPSSRIVAEADAMHVTWHASTAGQAARLQVALDGNVRLMHNESRIVARRVLLQFEDPQANESRPGHKPAAVQLQMDDAKSIELQAGRYYLPDDVQYFPPAPEKAAAKRLQRVYPVADLVIPIPSGPIKVSPSGALVKEASPATGKADFEALVELITRTIEPDSWQSPERPEAQGHIAAVPSSLSLVIRQDERAHAQIATLLNQLRRLQDIQVVLALERLEVSAAELEKAAANWPDLPLGAVARDPQSRAWSLKPEIVATLKSLPSAKVHTGPKITAFNGQSVDLRMAEEGGPQSALLSQLLIQPIVTADFRSLRLHVFGDLAPPAAEVVEDKLGLAGNKEPATNHLPVELRELALGQVLLVDESQFAWQEREKGVPVLDKVPHTSRLFRNASAKKPDTRHFYLVTPRVLVVEEEEEQVVAPPKKK